TAIQCARAQEASRLRSREEDERPRVDLSNDAKIDLSPLPVRERTLHAFDAGDILLGGGAGGLQALIRRHAPVLALALRKVRKPGDAKYFAWTFSGLAEARSVPATRIRLPCSSTRTRFVSSALWNCRDLDR